MIHRYKMTLALLILSSIGVVNAGENTPAEPVTLFQAAFLSLLVTVGSNIPAIYSFAKNSLFGAAKPENIVPAVLASVEQEINNHLLSVMRDNNSYQDLENYKKLIADKDKKMPFDENLNQSFLSCITNGQHPHWKGFNYCFNHANAMATQKESNAPENAKTSKDEDTTPNEHIDEDDHE